jgi:hypothetical protein
MANQRSTVMIVRVNIDKFPANTVNHPAVLHPIPLCEKKVQENMEIILICMK